MHYTNGNYQAFARPRKPRGVDEKSAYIVGAGLAGLAAAAFLVRDGQMEGKRITILEASKIAGGALDGIKDPKKGYLTRGVREFEDHMECTWDLWRSIPSLEIENASVLDEFFWDDNDDPNFSLRRSTQNRGEPNATDPNLTLSSRARNEMTKLTITREEDLADKRITDVLGREFFESNFWLYWRTMFAFEEWHSALEMKRYLNRFVDKMGGMADLSTIKATKYNNYESMIVPLVTWLEKQGVTIQYDTRVTNVRFDITPTRKVAKRIDCLRDGRPSGHDLTEDDLVFITNGSCVENSAWGDHHAVAAFDAEIHEGSLWALWRNIAKQDLSFGRPDKFCTDTSRSTWMSASLTTLDAKIPPLIEKITQRDPFSGRVVSGGAVAVRDSAWMMTWTCERQPHFKGQPKDQLVIYLYGLLIDRPGNFIKKAMRDCTGVEIAQEWLYHLGAPLDQIAELAETSTNCVPNIMPFITAFFSPRRAGDRPAVVPEHVVNCAFMGQFSETARDCVFTTEYSIRTAMEGVYALLDVERGVPEVWGSQFDVRAILNSITISNDGHKLSLPAPVVALLKRSDIGELLQEYGLIGERDEDRKTGAARTTAHKL